MEASKVFSEYELKKMAIKIAGEGETYQEASCVGSCEETMDTRKVTKKCRGIVAKTRVRGTGTGKLNISMHIPKAIYDGMYGMKLDTLIEGVRSYGQNSVHPEMSITQDVFDEDGNEKFKAYPRCILESGITRSIENGAEEVKEVELEISVMPDEFGNGMYEALASELKDETAKTTWLTNFSPEMVQKATESV